MSYLEMLIDALEGSFLVVVSKLVKLLAGARAAVPDLAGQVDWLVERLQNDVAGKITPEALREAVNELVSVFKDLDFGPPNPGAGGVA